MSYKLKSIAAAAVFALAATPAAAKSEIVSVTVDYSDLDLKQNKDVDRLNLRLDRAIATVCGRTSHQSLSLNRLTRPCRHSLEQETRAIVKQLIGGEVRVAKTIVISAEG